MVIPSFQVIVQKIYLVEMFRNLLLLVDINSQKAKSATSNFGVLPPFLYSVPLIHCFLILRGFDVNDPSKYSSMILKNIETSIVIITQIDI